jgi:hypothetical protein
MLGRRRDLRDLPLLITLLGDAETGVVIQALSSIRMVAQTNTVTTAIPAVAGLVAGPRPAVAA